MKALASYALALLTFWGTLVDQTTGQPLPGVRVTTQGPTSRWTTTDARGKFALTNLTAGHYVITVESRDVPPQHFERRLTKSTTQTLRACSTTLDYHCANSSGPSGAD